jgi:hypothetical protein
MVKSIELLANALGLVDSWEDFSCRLMLYSIPIVYPILCWPTLGGFRIRLINLGTIQRSNWERSDTAAHTFLVELFGYSPQICQPAVSYPSVWTLRAFCSEMKEDTYFLWERWKTPLRPFLSMSTSTMHKFQLENRLASSIVWWRTLTMHDFPWSTVYCH